MDRHLLTNVLGPLILALIIFAGMILFNKDNEK